MNVVSFVLILSFTAINPPYRLYVDALTSELLTIDGNHSDANRTRIARKVRDRICMLGTQNLGIQSAQ